MAVFDFSPLGQVGNNFVNAYDSGRKELLDDQKRQTLAALGQSLAGGGPIDYNKIAALALTTGDSHLGIGLLGLGEKARERQVAEEQGKSLSSIAFGGAPAAGIQPATPSPMVPNASPGPGGSLVKGKTYTAEEVNGAPIGEIPRAVVPGVAGTVQIPQTVSASTMAGPGAAAKFDDLNLALQNRAAMSRAGAPGSVQPAPGAVAPGAPALAQVAQAAADLPAAGASETEMATLATGEQVPKQYATPRLVNLGRALASNPRAPASVREPIMKLYSDEITRIRELEKEKRSEDSKAPEKKQEQESKLRGEFTKQIGTFNDVHDAYGRVISSIQQREANPANVSSASDIGLIFGYMKMLDPGSVVREGEFATAQNSGGIPAKIMNTYNKALSGEFLTPEQRQDFGETAKRLYDTSRKRADQYADRFGRLADGYKLDRKNIVDLPAAIDLPRVGSARTTEGSMIPGLPRNVDQPPATRPAGKTSGGVSWSIE